MGKVIGTTRQVAFHSLGDLSTPGGVAYLNHWALKITALVNDLARDLTSVTGSAGLRLVSFVGDGSTQEFVLPGKVLGGSDPIVLTPSGQQPGTSFTVFAHSGVQDSIKFTWIPRQNQVVLVYYQPA